MFFKLKSIMLLLCVVIVFSLAAGLHYSQNQTNTKKGTYLELDDVKLYYEVYGKGEPLLLLHGGIVDNRSWKFQIPELAKHFQVIAPDTRAHGRSTDSDKPLSYALFASDWVQLLKHLGIAKAHIVGWSDGGCTGLALGINHPEVVKSLVLIGTPYNISNYHDGILKLFEKITPESFEASEDPFNAKKMYQEVAPDPDYWPVLVKKLVNDMFTRDPNFTLDQLKTIQAPSLVMIGDKEQYYPLKHAEDMTMAIPNAELAVIPDATHMVAWEKPEEVNKAILDFLHKN